MIDYPCPLSIVTSFEKEDIDLNTLPFIENEIKGKDNNLYNLKIYNAKNSIIFFIKKYNSFLVINYKNKFTFEQLIKIDNFFKSFKSAEEIYTEFFQNFNQKEIIIFDNENKLNLNIKFEYLGKTKKIKFNFDMYNINFEKTLFKLCDKIKEIDKLNTNLEEKNKELQEKLNEQQNIIENNEKKMDGKINKIKEKNDMNKNKEIIEKFNKLKEGIKINEDKFEEQLKDFKNEINDNNKNEIDKFKKQIENNGKKISLFNNIFIITIILLNLLFISSKFNNKIDYMENIYKYSLNDLDNKYEDEINNIDNKYKNKINDIFKKFDDKDDYFHRVLSHREITIENKYNFRIDDLNNNYRNRINELNNTYNKKIDEINGQINEIKDIIRPDAKSGDDNCIIKYIRLSRLENTFSEKINNMEIKVNNMDNKVNNSLSSLSLFYLYFFNYKSLINYDTFNIFNSLLNEGIKKFFNKEFENMTLLYQGSIDGFDNNNYHEKCDDKKYTVKLVITEENIIFGGFTELELDRGFLKLGKRGFIFNLNEKNIYYSKEKYFFLGGKYFGPFLSDVFYINGKNGYNYNFYSTSDYFENKVFALESNNTFPIKDYAVFQIDI